jgi:transposase
MAEPARRAERLGPSQPTNLRHRYPTFATQVRRARPILGGVRLAPTLRRGDVVVLDNLSSHKSPQAAESLRSVGAWFLFLPPYSPDLNPIGMAFSKFKALIRKAAARSYDDLWKAVGKVCELFTEAECQNFFEAAGYEAE